MGNYVSFLDENKHFLENHKLDYNQEYNLICPNNAKFLQICNYGYDKIKINDNIIDKFTVMEINHNINVKVLQSQNYMNLQTYLAFIYFNYYQNFTDPNIISPILVIIMLYYLMLKNKSKKIKNNNLYI